MKFFPIPSEKKNTRDPPHFSYSFWKKAPEVSEVLSCYLEKIYLETSIFFQEKKHQWFPRFFSILSKKAVEASDNFFHSFRTKYRQETPRFFPIPSDFNKKTLEISSIISYTFRNKTPRSPKFFLFFQNKNKKKSRGVFEILSYSFRKNTRCFRDSFL